MTDNSEAARKRVGERAELLALAGRVEAYDPRFSPDNRADELALHQDIVMATGEGTLSPTFEQTFMRSIDTAMSLAPEGPLYELKALIHGAGHGASFWRVEGGKEELLGNSYAALPAQAFSAAALRARSKTQAEGR